MFKITTPKIAAFLSALFLSSPMAHAEALIGGGVMTDLSQACDPNDPQVTAAYMSFTMDFHPAELNPGRLSGITMQFPGGSLRFSYRGQFRPSPRFVTVGGSEFYQGRYTTYSTSPEIRVIRRLVTSPPGASFVNAEAIFLEFRVRNQWGISGCDARIEAVLGRPALRRAMPLSDAEGEAAAVSEEGSEALDLPGHPGLD